MLKREFPDTPLVGVGAIIFDEANRVLLIRRAKEPSKGRWSIPGGLVELGETVLDAVRREVLEETGISVAPQAIVEVVDRIYTASEVHEIRVRYHYVVIDYWCRVIEGQASAGSDAADLCWATAYEWQNSYGLEPVTIDVIEKGLAMAGTAGSYV